MIGFKKDGKFIPTGNKPKSNLKKSDVRKKVSSPSGVGHDIRNKFSIKTTKEIGLPSYLGGTNSIIVEMVHGDNPEVVVNGHSKSYHSEHEARKGFADVVTKEDAEKFISLHPNKDEQSRDKKSFDVPTSSEVPPHFVYDKDVLTKFDGRLFLIDESSMGLSVDEYKKLKNGDYEHFTNILFAEQGESVDEILSVTGGYYESGFGKEISSNEKFLEGLAGAGSLDEGSKEEYPYFDKSRDKKTLEDNGKPSKCPFCGNVFEGKSEFKAHRCIGHSPTMHESS